jgi:predicted MFS family arabinose efflux permease
MAATQDVSVDAYCIATVHKSRRGDLNGWMQMGMLGGRAIFGGAVLYFERWWGEPMTIGLMIACIWSSTVLVALAGDQTLRADTSQSDQSRKTAGFFAVLKSALRHRTTWFALLFAASGAAAFEATGALAGPLLIDHGISQKTAGIFFAFPVIVCMGLGALIGGNLSDRFGRYRSIVLLAVLGVTITLTSAAVLAFAEPSDVIVILCLAAVYLMIGGFTSASYALFMDLTDPRLGATQFSAFMGATNLCEVWAVFAAGKIAQSSGYPTALALMACGSLVALLPFRWLYSCQRRETQ